MRILNIKKQGMAIIMAMLIVSIAVSIAGSMLAKQNFLIQRVDTQNNLQNIQSLSLGAIAWAKIAISNDNNAVDYLKEIEILNIKHLNISEILQDKITLLNPNENIYLSAQMQDAQSKFNLNNIINWGDSLNNKRMPVSINQINFNFFQKILVKLGINPQLAWQTVYYIFASYNKNYTLDIHNNFNRPPISKIKNKNVITLDNIYDLEYIGYSADEIGKLSPYLNIINTDTKINVNTASSFILSTLFDNLGESANFFHKNPNLYANNVNQALTYLKVNSYNQENIEAQQILDVQTQFIEIEAVIEQQDYKYPFFVRINKQTKAIDKFKIG